MIIATHKELDKGSIDLSPYQHLIFERCYTDSDIIMKESVDYEEFNKKLNLISIDIDKLKLNLKFIFQDAYRKGREDAIEQMMHP